MMDTGEPSGADYWKTILGDDTGRIAWRSAPLSTDGDDYWHAGARISRKGETLTSVALALKDPQGEARRLCAIEDALVSGLITDADQVMDAVRDLVECEDDEYGSAAAKSYLAGWVCADVVGRCLK